jgi:arylsulfatase A-like enzyme
MEIPESVPLVTQVLSQAGYHTTAMGKMHMTPPRGPYGFDHLALSEDTGPGIWLDDFHPWCSHNGFVAEEHGLNGWEVLSTAVPLPDERTVTHWNGEQAVQYLKKQDGSRPFYSFVSFVKPHPPYDPPEKWADQIPIEDVPEPYALDRPVESYPKHVRRLADVNGWDRVMELGMVQQIRTHYLALVAQIDHEVGRILSTLEEQGLSESTLVIFSSDHGDFLGDHNLFMKFHPYEASANVPLIISGPGIDAGRVETPASHIDFVPTILRYCGLEVPETCQGIDLLGDRDGREGVLVQHNGRGFAWVTDQHKYIIWPTGEEELFDFKADPHEMQNLISDRPELYEELRGAMMAELVRLDACKVGNMPDLIRDGQPAVQESNQSFERLNRRYRAHRIPPHLLPG